MTETPVTTSAPARPPVVDRDAWEAARAELLAQEKAHTRAGDALAAARRRMPMVEVDGSVLVTGADGPVPFTDLFEGRDELVVYQHMWHDGDPISGQCPGCTANAWHVQRSAPYLRARGVSFAMLTEGPWAEVVPFLEFMGYTEPWYSVRDVPAPIGVDMGHNAVFLRDGDHVYLTYRTTGRGNEPAAGIFGLLDMTPYGRGEAWEDVPDGWPAGHTSCWYWATDADGNGTWGRPAGRPRSGRAPGRRRWCPEMPGLLGDEPIRIGL